MVVHPPVYINEHAWLTTLPHRIVPYYDEWLLGLLLRCDEVNHWECKTTLMHLFRSSKGKSVSRTFDLVVVASWMLESLDQLLMVPKGMLLKTTYYAELARLHGTVNPHASQLNRAFPFRLCPKCIEEARLLRRTVVLPHIMFCPLHHAAFLSKCQCGAVLEAFHQKTLPFVCHVCGLDWAHLPLLRPTLERSKLEQKLLSYYDFLFTDGTPELLTSTLQLIREKLKKEKISQIDLLDGKTKSVEHYELTKASVGYLVALLTSLDLSFPAS